MPVVLYYLGRPAQAWIAAMSGPARAATQNPCAATSLAPATSRPARDPPCRPPSERRRTKPVPAATAASADCGSAQHPPAAAAHPRLASGHYTCRCMQIEVSLSTYGGKRGTSVKPCRA